MRDAQKCQTSHPPRPSALSRAVPRARPQRVKKAEVEQRSDASHRSLIRNLTLPITLADFFSILLEERTERSH